VLIPRAKESRKSPKSKYWTTRGSEHGDRNLHDLQTSPKRGQVALPQSSYLAHDGTLHPSVVLRLESAAEKAWAAVTFSRIKKERKHMETYLKVRLEDSDDSRTEGLSII
jgi:hypothetical protein